MAATETKKRGRPKKVVACGYFQCSFKTVCGKCVGKCDCKYDCNVCLSKDYCRRSEDVRK